MVNYHETEIKNIKDTIRLYESLKVESESAHAENYNAVPDEVSPSTLTRKILYYKAALAVYEYFVEKLEGKECLMLGKYIGVSMCTFKSALRFNVYFEDSETENKLYEQVYSSHSGINEFVQKHFPDSFSVILGSTGNSHAFGNYDLKSAFSFFESFGYTDYKCDCLCWTQTSFYYQVEDAKKIIDGFFKLSKDTELMSDLDKVLTTYLDVIFKYNQEE